MLDRILFATPFDDDTNVTRLLACRHVVYHCPRETGESYSLIFHATARNENTRANILQLIQDTMAKWLIRAFPLCSCLDTRQPGNVFKKLDTRQSEILTNFLEMARLIPLRT